MYIRRAYQSPTMGTACGPQWAQMPNLASRNHAGHLYSLSDSIDGLKEASLAAGQPLLSSWAHALPAACAEKANTCTRASAAVKRSMAQVLMVWFLLLVEGDRC